MRRVLIIEDDKNVRVLLRRLLERKYRMSVLEAEDGIQGMEIYKKENPKMIFLDINMPNMNGMEFLTSLRSQDTETPVVVMSGFSEKDCVEKMMKLGVTDYMIKSEFILRLNGRIEGILDKNREVFSN